MVDSRRDFVPEGAGGDLLPLGEQVLLAARDLSRQLDPRALLGLRPRGFVFVGGHRRIPPGGRDSRAALHRAAPGKPRLTQERRATVVGGGIAGVAAAAVLAERGASVTLIERDNRLGGRVSAWPINGERTMSRGFHAFFRQYYAMRALVRRADPTLSRLIPIDDYPLQRPDGMRDSFAAIPRTPPFSVIGFVLQSPSFPIRALASVNIPAAVELMLVRFPGLHERYEGESAAAFLDRLRFPASARDLALEVFARSFFADPDAFSAGELVSMFHSYFIGSAEGLLFDVPNDDYETAIWAPMREYLEGIGVTMRTETEVVAISETGVKLAGSEQVPSDAVVLAADPRSARELIRSIRSDDESVRSWQEAAAQTHNAPPFVVVRLWLEGRVRADRPAFLGTSGYGPLDNISVLERFEEGAREWSKAHGGSVVELHAYACDEAVRDDESALAEAVDELQRQLHRAFPEVAKMRVLEREVLVRDDCTVIEPTGWAQRPGVQTPLAWLTLAGDWVRIERPVALMERAASTGFEAANALLAGWGVRGEDVFSAPMRGLLAWPARGRRGGRASRAAGSASSASPPSKASTAFAAFATSVASAEKADA